MTTIVRREPQHVRNHPLAGDVIELTERHVDPVSGEQFDAETMLRVVAVHEGRVWYKEYGKGHDLLLLSKWQERFDRSSARALIRGADHDAPF